MPKVLLIGAGLTNLSLAWSLEQQGFFDYQVVEAQPFAAGLLQTSSVNGFLFDHTGHFLHVGNPEFQKFLESVFGLKNFNVLRRQSYVFSHGVYTPYPFQKNLFGLPQEVIKECIDGFVKRPKIDHPKTFYSWVMTNFGKGLGKHFFFPYNSKLFCRDTRKITASWMGRFVPNTTLEDLVAGSKAEVHVDYTGYNGAFLFPKTGGISQLIDAITGQLKNQILYNHTLESVDSKTKVAKFSGGLETTYSRLISTVPLNKLLPLLGNSSLEQASKNLKHNSVVNINFGVNVPELSHRHWVYFQEPQFPFYRMGFWHNFNDKMAPLGCSSVYLESSLINATPKKVAELEERSLAVALDFLGLKRRQICAYKNHFLSHAYVIYDPWRDQNLPDILKTLEEKNIHSIGRFGAWKYSSMQEAFLDGQSCAKLIIKEL